jgi:hypothetical protein
MPGLYNPLGLISSHHFIPSKHLLPLLPRMDKITKLPIAYILEDRTGVIGDSDFDDVYDRKFMRICKSGNTISIFDVGIRSSKHNRSSGGYGLLEPIQPKPSAVLELTEHGHLGIVSYAAKSKKTVELPMDRYLTKTSIFSRCVFRLYEHFTINFKHCGTVAR